MTRYIEIDSAIDEMKSLTSTIGGVSQITPEGKESAIRLLDEQPTADVKPAIHAYWKERKQDQCYCSNCNNLVGFLYRVDVPYRYCPQCGAKMDGKK